MIKIAICDDHKIVREGLKQIIQANKQFKVLCDVSSGESLLEQLHLTIPQVIILDIALPGRNGLDVLKQIKALYPDVQVLILSMFPEDQFAIRVVKAGASGYLHKDSPPDVLCKAIKMVAAGEKYISPKLSELLIRELVGFKTDARPHERLSDREYEVLLLLGEGKKVGEIANLLSLSIKTVSTYKSRIYEKLNISNQAEVFQYLISNRLLPSSKE